MWIIIRNYHLDSQGPWSLFPRIFDPLGGSGKPGFSKLRFLQPLPSEIWVFPENVAIFQLGQPRQSAPLMPPGIYRFPGRGPKALQEGLRRRKKPFRKSAVFSHALWEPFIAILFGFYLPEASQNGPKIAPKPGFGANLVLHHFSA